MQEEIAKRGIAIETNPSSNYLIGTFRQYEKHPIIRFYNKGLIHEPEKLRVCPQLSVSINTDDQGVFSTSLENECALMARALEAVKDEYGNYVYNKSDIYEWLDIKKYQETWVRHSWHLHMLETEMLRFISNIGPYNNSNNKIIFAEKILKIWDMNQEKFVHNMEDKERTLTDIFSVLKK